MGRISRNAEGTWVEEAGVETWDPAELAEYGAEAMAEAEAAADAVATERGMTGRDPVLVAWFLGNSLRQHSTHGQEQSE